MAKGAKTSDAARRNTRMRFEQWAKNPSCEANTVSAVRNIKMARVAEHEGLTATFGQSPFAIARGDQFERLLFRANAEGFIAQLIERDVLHEGATGFEDYRLKMNGGTRLRTLDEAIDATKSLLSKVASATSPSKRKALPAVIAAATLRIPRGIMLPEAVLIIDALAIRTDGDRPKLLVGEVKTYPDRGGFTSAGELATARAQAGLYVHALDVVADELGVADAVEVSRTGFLVLSRPGSNMASIRAGEDLEYQARRAERGFQLLEAAGQALPAGVFAVDDDAPPEDLLDLVVRADTAYGEGCLSFCDRAAGCFRRSLDDGDPVVLGEDVRRFLGSVSLDRAIELLHDPDLAATEVEVDLVRRIAESDGMAVQ